MLILNQGLPERLWISKFKTVPKNLNLKEAHLVVFTHILTGNVFKTWAPWECGLSYLSYCTRHLAGCLSLNKCLLTLLVNSVLCLHSGKAEILAGHEANLIKHRVDKAVRQQFWTLAQPGKLSVQKLVSILYTKQKWECLVFYLYFFLNTKVYLQW